MRAIFQFGKTRRLICVSHLDLQRFMHMALRRTNLPVAYSQGFNPHPVMSFASALAMGWTSDAELFDIKLAQDVEPMEAIREMKRALPPDLPLHGVRLVDDRFPALMARLTMADYVVTLRGEGARDIAESVEGFLREASVLAMRKTKSGEKQTDVRPMTHILTTSVDGDGIVLNARLSLTERATFKPDLLLRVLAERAGVKVPESVYIHRSALLACDADGNPVDLFALRA